MMTFSRRTIAAAAITAVGATGAVAAAAGTHGGGTPADAATATPATTTAPQVRTIVVHRTVKRVRHLPAKAPVARVTAAPPSPTETPAPAQASEPTPVQRTAPRAQRIADEAPDQSASEPLRTATSGAGYGDDEESGYDEDRDEYEGAEPGDRGSDDYEHGDD